MVSLSNHAKMALPSTYSKKSCRLIQHTKTSLILPLVLSGGNASGNFRKSGKDRRFGLWETPGRGGSVQSCDVGQDRLPGRVVHGIATTATPTKDFSAPEGPPVFPTFSTARRESGRGNGPPHCKQSLRRYGRIDQTHGVIAFPRRRTVHGGNLAALLVDDHRHRQAERQVLTLEFIEHAHGRIAVERQ
jgi:hypothetical protein